MPFQKGYTPWNKKGLPEPNIIQCSCGCGDDMPEFDKRGRAKKFIYGHGNRGRRFPGLNHDRQFRPGDIPWNKGVHVENAGTFKVGHVGLKGALSPSWKGGIAYIGQGLRRSPEYAKWRLEVFERDDFTCQLCHKRGSKLFADHHPYPFHSHPDKRLDVSNGRTLCYECNYYVTYVIKEWANQTS